MSYDECGKLTETNQLYKLVKFLSWKLTKNHLTFKKLCKILLFHNRLIRNLYLKSIVYDRSREVRTVLKFWFDNYQELNSHVSGFEMVSILQSIVDTKNIDGDIIELGVYHGGTTILMAKILQELNITNKKIYACDTFSSFPYTEDILKRIKKYNFSDNDVQIIRKKLIKYDVVNYVELVVGNFDDTLQNIHSDNKYVVAFVDCDLYKSAKVALGYLKQTMSEKGLVFIHDYDSTNWAISKAIDEFDNKNDRITLITDIEKYPS